MWLKSDCLADWVLVWNDAFSWSMHTCGQMQHILVSCLFLHIRVSTMIYTHDYILSKYVYVYVYIHIYIYTYIYIHIHTYIHTYTHTYIHTDVHTYAYIHTYIHTHTCILKCADPGPWVKSQIITKSRAHSGHVLTFPLFFWSQEIWWSHDIIKAQRESQDHCLLLLLGNHLLKVINRQPLVSGLSTYHLYITHISSQRWGSSIHWTFNCYFSPITLW